MNNIRFVIVFVLCFSKVIFSQTKAWETYDLDSIVSIDMPFDVYELDTIQNNQKLLQIFSGNDTLEFVAQKFYLGKLYSNIEIEPLPYNNRTLDEKYSNIISILAEMLPYELEHTQAIEYNNLKGYKLLFKNKKGLPVQEMSLILVNKNLYNFSYQNYNGLDKTDQKLFFESITFNKEKELNQFIKHQSYYYKMFFLVIFIILLLSFFLRLKPRKKLKID